MISGYKATLLFLSLALGLACEPAYAQSSPSSFTTGYRYDAMHQLTGTISADPNGSGHYLATRNTYDSMGRLIKVEKGQLSTWQSESVAPASWGANFTIFDTLDTTYDLAGNKLKDATSSGGTTYEVKQYSYDALDRLNCTTVRMDSTVFGSLPSDACTASTTGTDHPDRISQNIYDAANQLLQNRKAVGTTIEQAYATYSYTPNGKKQDIVDANGNHSLEVYDGLDRLSKWEFPSPTAPTSFNPATPATALATAGAVNSTDYEQYSYDANSNRTSLRKRDANVINYGFDALNRMTAKTGSALADVNYSYDLLGHQLTSLFASTGQGRTSVYDGFGRITSATDTMGGGSLALGFQYDADSNRTCIVYPDGSYFNTDYDGLNRATTTYENGTGGTCSKTGAPTLFTISYNSQGLRQGISRFNGASTVSSTSYTYDGVLRLSGLGQDFAGTTNDQSWTIAYNPASQIGTLNSSNDAFAWTGGVNANNAYTPNGLNQYSNVAGASFTYDPNGNLTSDGTTTYGYDVENQLVSATGAHSAALTYDPSGRLYRLDGVNPNSKWGVGTWGAMIWSAGGTTKTRFLYDGDSLVAEYDGSGHLLRRYVDGPDPDEPLVWYEGSDLSNRHFLHADHQGSVVAISTSVGALSNIDSYDEYGIPATSNAGRFQYTGQIWLPEVGLYHYKARAYSPTLGRFMQTDPVGYQDQINLYAYVDNDPVNGSDPTGDAGANTCSRAGASSCTGDYMTDPNHFNANQQNAPGVKTKQPAATQPIVAPPDDSKSEEQATQDAQDQTSRAIGEFLNPVQPIVDCVKHGCNLVEAAMAALSVIPLPVGKLGKVFSLEQQALVDMAKADARVGVSKADMEAYIDLNKGLGKEGFPRDRVRIDEGHPTRGPHSQAPHGHVGPVNHIPITDP